MSRDERRAGGVPQRLPLWGSCQKSLIFDLEGCGVGTFGRVNPLRHPCGVPPLPKGEASSYPWGHIYYIRNEGGSRPSLLSFSNTPRNERRAAPCPRRPGCDYWAVTIFRTRKNHVIARSRDVAISRGKVGFSGRGDEWYGAVTVAFGLPVIDTLYQEIPTSQAPRNDMGCRGVGE